MEQVQKDKKFSIILSLFGRYEILTKKLEEKLEQLNLIKDDAEIIIIADGPRWIAPPMLQMLTLKIPTCRLEVMGETTHLPAKLFKRGIELAQGEYVIFSTLAGTNIYTSLNLFQNAVKAEDLEQNGKTINQHKSPEAEVYYIHPENPRESDIFLSEALYGQIQCLDCLHIDEWCVRKSVFERMGPFNENPLLQYEFERYIALTFLRLASIKETGMIPDNIASDSLAVYPFETRLCNFPDLARRYAIYCNTPAFPERNREICDAQFLRDLSNEEALIFSRLTGLSLPTVQTRYTNHYRIFVIGGYWEYHHNQLAFFSYLEDLYGNGFATYRSGLDVITEPIELIEYDLVIFTRCRSKQSLTLMKFCQQQNIPTIYMIDDNWFSVAKDHPDQGGIFVPGNENYENFIEAINYCKTTWLYNDLLQNDVMPYSRNVQKFTIGIDPRMFRCAEPRRRSDDLIYVGFSGTLRWYDCAFRALARLARRYKNVQLVLFGDLSASQASLFKGLSTIRIPMTSYVEYAKNMAYIQPDLLIAPLESTHTNQSKCFNKYLENGIVGAAGVYSKTKPYTDVIIDNFNGFIIDSETEECWYDKLTEILSDTQRLRTVQQTAKKDVFEHYTVEKLSASFADKLINIVENEVLIDD